MRNDEGVAANSLQQTRTLGQNAAGGLRGGVVEMQSREANPLDNSVAQVLQHVWVPLSSTALIRHSTPDSGLGFRVKTNRLLQVVPCMLDSGRLR